MKRYLTKIVLVVLILGVFGVFYSLDGEKFLTIGFLKENHNWLSRYYELNKVKSLFGFFFTYVLLTAFSIPFATVLSLGAGSIFGFSVGLTIVSFASSIGATLSFLAARYFFKNLIQKRFGHLLEGFNKGLEKNGLQYLISLRLIPIAPFFLINLIFGLTNIRASHFYISSQLGMLFGTAIYINAGVELSKIETIDGIVSPRLLISLSLIGLVPLISIILKKNKI
jgi:uncharacterized membrane protein YdjX (TVP38/TMEM64 family)